MYRLRAVLRSPIVRCSPLISKQKFVTTQQIFNKIDEVKPTDHDIIEDFLKEDKNGEDVGEDDLLMKDFFESFNLQDSKPSEILGGGDKSSSEKFDFLDKIGTEESRDELGEDDLESKYLHEERETMLNIFNKYLGDEDGSKLSSESRILFGELSDSKSKTEQINDIILSYAGTDKRPRVVEAVGDSRSVVAETSAAAVAAGATAESIGSVDVATELQDKIKLSLEPSLNLIQKNMSLVELYEFFEKLRGTWKQQPKGESLFIRDLLVSGNVEGRNSLVEEIRKHSKETPETPVVNVFTLPILINFIIKTVSFKYQDPQLSLSIFNLLKDDLNFYTICCNQQTYNEIMRIHWIFNGKSNLYGVEMILLEMVNNGFNGDLMTFNLLEKIIVDYHNMRLGIDLHGSNRVQSIWNNEDDKRVHVLEKKLHAMGNRLRKEKGEKLF